MAIPKTLREISKETALKTISRHIKAGTGKWEGQPDNSDFVYKFSNGYKLIRPPYGAGNYETGVVSM